MAGFSSKKPPSMSNDRLESLLPIYEFKSNDGKTVKFRPIGNIISYEYVWFWIKTDQGKVTQIPKLCIDLDPITDEYISDVCPFRGSGQGRSDRFYLVNGIFRKAEGLRPAKLPKLLADEKKLARTSSFDDEMYYTKMGSESWTPVVPLKLSSSAVRNISALESDNIVDGKSYGCTDPDYGFDIAIKYDSKGTGTGKFQVSKGNETELSDDDMNYLVYDLDVMKYPSPKAAAEEWKNLKDKLTDPPKDPKKGGATASRRLEEDEEDDDVRSRPKPNSSKLTSRRRAEEDEEVPY